jgi:hypothetical protein
VEATGGDSALSLALGGTAVLTGPAMIEVFAVINEIEFMRCAPCSLADFVSSF